MAKPVPRIPGDEDASPEVDAAPSPAETVPAETVPAETAIAMAGRARLTPVDSTFQAGPLPDPAHPMRYEDALLALRSGEIDPPVFTDRGYLVDKPIVPKS